MSTETPERTHDPAGRVSENEEGGDRDEGSNYDESGDGRREYDRDYEDLLAERDRLAEEVARLERELRRKESRLDAVVARYERILEARTESYRRRIAENEDGEDGEGGGDESRGGEDGDGENADDVFRWTGRRQESGPLARLKNLLR